MFDPGDGHEALAGGDRLDAVYRAGRVKEGAAGRHLEARRELHVAVEDQFATLIVAWLRQEHRHGQVRPQLAGSAAPHHAVVHVVGIAATGPGSREEERPNAPGVGGIPERSEERRVGKGWVSTCRSRWSAEL